jgi:hypothetical protein
MMSYAFKTRHADPYAFKTRIFILIHMARNFLEKSDKWSVFHTALCAVRFIVLIVRRL